MKRKTQEVFFCFGGKVMARASDGASGSAVGKAMRVAPGAPGGLVPKGADRPRAADQRVARPARWQPRRLPKLWNTGMQYLTDVRAEMNRVAWPDRQTVIASTVVVLFVLTVTALYLAGWDYLFAQLFSYLFTH
jgi:preprotein translocase SecE subunit